MTYPAAYRRAQVALAELKSAVLDILVEEHSGITNAEIGRALGIYRGHVGHEGHISRTLLELLRADGTAEQDPETKRWRLKRDAGASEDRDQRADD